MKVRPVFAWYDLWIGVFVDRSKRRVYVLLLPCLGIVIERTKPQRMSAERDIGQKGTHVRK